MQRVPSVLIEFQPHRGKGTAGWLRICPYAAVLWRSEADAAEIVTDFFQPLEHLPGEVLTLADCTVGTEIASSLVEAIGHGCDELGAGAVARLHRIDAITLAAPRFAETVLVRRGVGTTTDGEA